MRKNNLIIIGIILALAVIVIPKLGLFTIYGRELKCSDYPDVSEEFSSVYFANFCSGQDYFINWFRGSPGQTNPSPEFIQEIYYDASSGEKFITSGRNAGAIYLSDKIDCDAGAFWENKCFYQVYCCPQGYCKTNDECVSDEFCDRDTPAISSLFPLGICKKKSEPIPDWETKVYRCSNGNQEYVKSVTYGDINFCFNGADYNNYIVGNDESGVCYLESNKPVECVSVTTEWVKCDASTGTWLGQSPVTSGSKLCPQGQKGALDYQGIYHCYTGALKDEWCPQPEIFTFCGNPRAVYQPDKPFYICRDNSIYKCSSSGEWVEEQQCSSDEVCLIASEEAKDCEIEWTMSLLKQFKNTWNCIWSGGKNYVYIENIPSNEAVCMKAKYEDIRNISNSITWSKYFSSDYGEILSAICLSNKNCPSESTCIKSDKVSQRIFDANVEKCKENNKGLLVFLSSSLVKLASGKSICEVVIEDQLIWLKNLFGGTEPGLCIKESTTWYGKMYEDTLKFIYDLGVPAKYVTVVFIIGIILIILIILNFFK